VLEGKKRAIKEPAKESKQEEFFNYARGEFAKNKPRQKEKKTRDGRNEQFRRNGGTVWKTRSSERTWLNSKASIKQGLGNHGE